MDIHFHCEKCQQHLVIDETGAGMTTPCPKCGTMLTVPTSSQVASLNTEAGANRESPVSAPRLFDLNIEQILENWEVCHAIRELIANAIDEQVISKSKPIEISKDGDNLWHIRDYGRGLRIEHLTLNECQEKLQIDSGIIGKFGVGLKDALATLHRHGVQVFSPTYYAVAAGCIPGDSLPRPLALPSVSTTVPGSNIHPGTDRESFPQNRSATDCRGQCRAF